MVAKPVIASALLLTLLAQTISYGYQAAGQIQTLNIEIVEGEGAVNNIRQRMAREPMVQVTDENRKPVAGAAVVFLLPNQGAGGTFANGARSLTTLTDANGNAVARGLQANRLSGQYQVRVTASHQGRTASTSITMTNAALTGAAAGGAALKWLLILGVAGGAAAGVAVAATGGNGGSPSRPSTTVTPGTPNVGAPQ
ncbi:MAG: carboxypeptidase-like regulatory domain-containing protein [Bryobacteraceae bacterium]